MARYLYTERKKSFICWQLNFPQKDIHKFCKIIKSTVETIGYMIGCRCTKNSMLTKFSHCIIFFWKIIVKNLPQFKYFVNFSKFHILLDNSVVFKLWFFVANKKSNLAKIICRTHIRILHILQLRLLVVVAGDEWVPPLPLGWW